LLGDRAHLLTPDDVGIDADLPETGRTYAANAQQKSEAASTLTGMPALADDSGIEVLALDGWPGPRSARWLGPDATDHDRLHALLDEVQRRAPHDRRARYVAAVALARPGQPTTTATGECSGLLVEPRGTAGFGYDPSFLSDDLGITFGEASDADKDRVSHRARAVRALLADLSGR
jgi:XTP/dITP diphosphohydrolase